MQREALARRRSMSCVGRDPATENDHFWVGMDFAGQFCPFVLICKGSWAVGQSPS